MVHGMNVDTGQKSWLTPPRIINALGTFSLDPCCPPKMPWRTATHMVCRPDDGLAVDWTGKRVWLNPPYGRESIPFLRKMCGQVEDGGGGTSIRTYRHKGMARTCISIREGNHVHARPHKVPSCRRFRSGKRKRTIIASGILGV